MSSLLLLLCAVHPVMPRADQGPPAVGHIWEFPTQHIEQQLQRCKEHIDRLDHLRRYRPGQEQQYRAWIVQTRWLLRYWEILATATDVDHGDDWKRARMYDLWLHIGSERYEQRWTPILLPGDILPRPRGKPEDCNGAN